MMMRGSDIRRNTHGILGYWRSGGYSEDMITSAICAEKVWLRFPVRWGVCGRWRWRRTWWLAIVDLTVELTTRT